MSATPATIASLYPVGDDAPSIQAQLNLLSTGSFTLPANVNLLSPVRLENKTNFSILPPVGGSTVRGSIQVNPALVVPATPRYAEIPAEVVAQTWVFTLPVDATSSLGGTQHTKGGFWDTAIAPHEVYVNDVPLQETAWPAAGWNRATSVSGADTIGFSTMPAFNSNNYTGANRMRVEGFAYMPEFGDYWGPCTRSGTTIVFDSPGGTFQGTTVQATCRFKIRNILEQLALNTYYVDLAARLVYLCVASDPRPYTRISVAVGPAFILGSGCTNITIGAITVSQRRGDGILVQVSGVSPTFDGTIVQDIGRTGIDCQVRTDNLLIKNNAIVRRTGGVGIWWLTGDRSTLTSGSSTIQDLTLDNCGTRTLAYATGLRVAGVGGTVQRVSCKNFVGAAIMVTSIFSDLTHKSINDFTFDSVDFTDVCTDVGDHGCLYGVHDPNSWGNVFTNITATRCYSRNGNGGEVFVIYADNGLCGWTVTGMVLEACDAAGIIGGGRNVAFRNIVSHNGIRSPIYMDNRCAPASTQWTVDDGNDSMLFYYNQARALLGDPFAKYGAQYTAIQGMAGSERGVPENCQIRSVSSTGTTPSQTDYSASFSASVNVSAYP